MPALKNLSAPNLLWRTGHSGQTSILGEGAADCDHVARLLWSQSVLFYAKLKFVGSRGDNVSVLRR